MVGKIGPMFSSSSQILWKVAHETAYYGFVLFSLENLLDVILFIYILLGGLGIFHVKERD